mmetsp:Transcript_65445/g.151895  ORF Transcript_65445/g.151895 Transcript_65445/m.151895 type:complete len:94 (+) Transcript_65445:2509-2790(+)
MPSHLKEQQLRPSCILLWHAMSSPVVQQQLVVGLKQLTQLAGQPSVLTEAALVTRFGMELPALLMPEALAALHAPLCTARKCGSVPLQRPDPW